MPDTKGAVVRAVPQAGLGGYLSAAQAVIEGVSHFTWFGPLPPITPQAPAGTEPRRYDYPVGINISYVPRAEEAITMDQLRNLAEIWDLLRLVIETRKDQLVAVPWKVRIKQLPNERNLDYKLRAKDDPRVQAATNLFRMPDGDHLWQSWIRMALEDVFVLDALTLYPFKSQSGEAHLDILDGATIKRLLDPEGRTPDPPDAAYQQIIKGVPAHSFTRDQLLYRPRNPRSWRLYGMGPTEQIVLTINLAVRRQMWKLSYYTEGTLPEAIAQVPDTWPPDKIKQFQEWWDSMLAGDLGRRRRIFFVPSFGGKDSVSFPKQDVIKDEMDEWLARVVCYAFSVSPQPFLAQGQSRYGVAMQAQMSKSEGLLPMLNWLSELMTDVLARFGWDDMEFVFEDVEEPDALKRTQIQEIRVRSGISRVDEVREENGDEPIGVGAGIVTGSGFVAFPGEEGGSVAAAPSPTSGNGDGPPRRPGSGVGDGHTEDGKRFGQDGSEVAKVGGGVHAFASRSQRTRLAELQQTIATFLARSRQETVRRVLAAYKPHAPPPDGKGDPTTKRLSPPDGSGNGKVLLPPPPPPPPVVINPDWTGAAELAKAVAEAARAGQPDAVEMVREITKAIRESQPAAVVAKAEPEPPRAHRLRDDDLPPFEVAEDFSGTELSIFRKAWNESIEAGGYTSAAASRYALKAVDIYRRTGQSMFLEAAVKAAPTPTAPQQLDIHLHERPDATALKEAFVDAAKAMPPAQPVVHVPAPVVHVTTPEPVVHVAPEVTVQPTPVTIIKKKVVKKQKRPKVNVNVEVKPELKVPRTRKTVHRDPLDRIKSIDTEPLPDPDADNKPRR